jgi:3-phenylpropionate/trans-cinnamate dioxygenase ferredoxin reductase subunit
VISAGGRVVIVGAGLAGLGTAQALRAQGYAGGLALVGAEPHPPYDRPPLSKAVLQGDADDSTLEVDWAALDVDLRTGVAATGLRAGAVETDRGVLEADAVVLATGARPRRLPGGDAGAGEQVVLRTIDDALALRARLVTGARVAVVGAGWIGAEVATAAARAGCRTTVVEALDAPLAQALPAELGRRTLEWYAAAGVEVRLGVRVASVDRGAVHLAGGEELPADVVVAGVGVRPDTGWLLGSPVDLTPHGAVRTDEHLRTGTPGVFAVGDCAAWRSLRYGTSLTLEHWDTALHAPATVAANLLGGSQAYDPVPYFWSEQLGHMLQYAGHWAAGSRTVHRDDGVSWAAFRLDGDRLVAAVTADRPRDLMQARRLMERDAAVDDDRLADPGVQVKAAAA